MQRSLSFLFRLSTVFALLLICVMTQVANAKFRCEEVFHAAPEEAWLSKNTPIKYVLKKDSGEYDLMARRTQALHMTLQSANRHENKISPVHEFKITSRIPTNTKDLQLLGYNLMHSMLTNGYIKLSKSVTVHVSVRPVSMSQLIDRIIHETGSGIKDRKIQETLTEQIEMIAALVGSPADRQIISTYAAERTGDQAQLLGPGQQVTSIAIINRRSGRTVTINFFELEHQESFDLPKVAI